MRQCEPLAAAGPNSWPAGMGDKMGQELSDTTLHCPSLYHTGLKKCIDWFYSPHHCLGFLFFAWIPPLLFRFPLPHFSPSTHHSSTSHHPLINHSSTHHQLITAPILTIHSSQLNSSQLPITAPLLGRWAAAAFRVAGAAHRASWSNCGARGCRWAAAAFRTTHHSSTYHITTSHHNSSQLITLYHIPTHHSSTSHTSLITAPLLITTHHSSTSHRSTSHHCSQVHFSSQLITSQLITVPLLTPHLSHLTYHITTSHHNLSHPNSSQLHFSHHFSHLTYHIRTHHSSTSHAWHHKSTSHTSLLTPHFSHLPEVHIKLRYIKAWHVGLSGPFIFYRVRNCFGFFSRFCDSFLGISCSVHVPCYLQHFGAGTCHCNYRTSRFP